jgi:hypothetical protein
LPSSIDDVVDRFEGQPAATRDDVTRTSDGGEVRTAADLEAFVDQLRSEGLLTS